VEPEPTRPQDKIRKYAKLGYEFQLLKRWNKYYLYARKWVPENRKRDCKYIGPWTDQLKEIIEGLGIKLSKYE
jgi:hypothetical protein